MSEQINIEETKEILQEMAESLKNKSYPDWDNVILQINQGDKGVAHIRMMRQDMEAMMSLHETERKDIIEIMFQALEEQIENKES